ncbi:MAG: DUF4111 domain-containing protein [Thermoleophilia bacterium]|nr:DUF4111 domain-containing protein [Thermoleophilia bacterium]MDQ3859373.1 DUF4111 domain-containing protein [Actinomycetota bacterium]
MDVDVVAAYDGQLVGRVRDVLAERLVGVYVSGSGVLGDYVHGRSDLDRFAVCDREAGEEAKAALVDALRHESLPCPARALEFVLYRRAAVARPTSGGAFELNLNTGAAIPLHVSFDPGEEPPHWFLLDRAIVHAHGRALTGPPAHELFAPLPRAWLLDALAESLRWHRENEGVAGENTVLNACRAWYFVEEGDWVSKLDAAKWARARTADPNVVDAALAAGHGVVAPFRFRGIASADALVDEVERAVARARYGDRFGPESAVATPSPMKTVAET